MLFSNCVAIPHFLKMIPADIFVLAQMMSLSRYVIPGDRIDVWNII